MSKFLHFVKIAFTVGAWAIVVLIIALLCGAFSRGSGSHVSSVSWLPKTASDISYSEDNGLFYHFCYECTMAPEDFQAFAKEQGWMMTEKRDFYGTGSRRKLELPSFGGVGNEPPDRYASALVYENVAANGGGIRVIYDPERRRLFFDESSH